MPESVNTSALSTELPECWTEIDDKPVMIKIDHVSMVFNMASEQLNSLKEYAIKIMKRELFFDGFKALDDVSFEVKKGDVFGIMGTNGSGKSTLMKIIAGVLEPSSGLCEIKGNIAPLIELGAGFDMDLTARENIYLNGALLGYSKEFISDHFDEIVEFAEIRKFLDMPMKNYSSGMVARIAFAIATVIVPEILIVDEVLSVGDFMFQKKCEDRINELIEDHGVTVLIVSHSNEQIARMCNKAIWIEKGHTRLLGEASAVCRIYDNLGGRTGSAESEQRVFEALEHGIHAPISKSICNVFKGSDSDSTNAKLILRGWQGIDADTIILVSNSSHVNAVLAAPLAGVYDAPILPIGINDISGSVERILFEKKPQKIIIVDCGNHSSAVLNVLHEYPWQYDIVTFNNENGDVFDLSVDIFKYGLNKNLWGCECSVVDFQSNLESLLFTPYLSKQRCPVFLMAEQDSKSEILGNLLVGTSVEEITVIGNLILAELPISAKVTYLSSSSSSSSVDLIVERVLTALDQSIEGVFAASYSLAQWPDLLSVGSCAAKHNSLLMLVDERNLDSVSSCLSVMEEAVQKGCSSISILGNESGLSSSCRDLLSSYLAWLIDRRKLSPAKGMC